jgi:hypothetical protein
MYEHNAGKDSRDKLNRPSAQSKTAERRGANRHTITAAAEIVDIASGARFTTRTSDLGPGGCFVDSLTPFPIGSKVQVTVRQSDSEFQVGGAVVYSQVGLGMGIAFDELTYEQRLDLEAWLLEVATGKSQSLEKQTAPKTEPKLSDMHRATLAGLIKLLVSKRILTDSEAASLLQDPIL